MIKVIKHFNNLNVEKITSYEKTMVKNRNKEPRWHGIK